MNESFDPLERIKILTAHVKQLKFQRHFDTVGHRAPKQSDSAYEHLCYARSAFLTGALPNAETLLFIALSIDRYIEGKGGVTLDEAFQLRSRPKAGNPSRQAATRNEKGSALLDMAFLRAENPRMSLAHAAAGALAKCQKDTNLNAGTLEREYKRRRFDQVFRVRGK